MTADPRSMVRAHILALETGGVPWLPILHSHPEVDTEIYDQLVWEDFQADYPEFFDADIEEAS